MNLEPRKRGRPATITFEIEKSRLQAADKRIKQLFETTIRKFSKSGAYIPISQEYENHTAFVIVLEK